MRVSCGPDRAAIECILVNGSDVPLRISSFSLAVAFERIKLTDPLGRKWHFSNPRGHFQPNAPVADMKEVLGPQERRHVRQWTFPGCRPVRDVDGSPWTESLFGKDVVFSYTLRHQVDLTTIDIKTAMTAPLRSSGTVRVTGLR